MTYLKAGAILLVLLVWIVGGTLLFSQSIPPSDNVQLPQTIETIKNIPPSPQVKAKLHFNNKLKSPIY